VIVVTEIQIVAGRQRELRKAGLEVALPHEDELLRLMETDGLQQDRIDDGEDGAVRSMPRARARIETQAKPGLRARVRAAYLRSRRAEVNMLHILIGAKIKYRMRASIEPRREEV
jgi:hypothetical protein